MKRTPQRSLLLLGLSALIWGAALLVAASLHAEPALLLTVWGAGAALLVLLAFYLGLSFVWICCRCSKSCAKRLPRPMRSRRSNPPWPPSGSR
jgi:hypothetical protein